MPRQFIITLPRGVPLPKFQLFQRVRLHDHEPTEVGTIVGLTYFSPKLTKIEKRQPTGWEYTVDAELEPRQKRLEPVTYVPEDAIAEVLN